jgi:hypothetical protein
MQSFGRTDIAQYFTYTPTEHCTFGTLHTLDLLQNPTDYMGEQSNPAKIAEMIMAKGFVDVFGDSVIPEQQQIEG